jgi:hypothetical protein
MRNTLAPGQLTLLSGYKNEASPTNNQPNHSSRANNIIKSLLSALLCWIIMMI